MVSLSLNIDIRVIKGKGLEMVFTENAPVLYLLYILQLAKTLDVFVKEYNK